jgi:hypothetical protein
VADPAIRREITLVDLLDRVLDSGIAAVGDVTLSVAGVDLVYVSLRALIASMATVNPHHHDIGSAPRLEAGAATRPGRRGTHERMSATRATEIRAASSPPPPQSDQPRHSLERGPSREPGDPGEGTGLDALDSLLGRLPATPSLFSSRADADPENVERGLARLVLMILELLRELMERQAIRRMELGGLDEGQIERMGDTFLKLRQRMTELKETFGIEEEDLTIRLGALGDLFQNAAQDSGEVSGEDAEPAD